MAQTSENYLTDQSLNIVASPLIPLDCHIFLRNEPPADSVEPSVNLHRHFMLWFCLNGRGRMEVEGIPYTLASGEAMLLAPGQPHRRLSFHGEKVEWLMVRFSLEHEPEWLMLMRNQLFCFEGEVGKLLAGFRDACISYRNEQLPANASKSILHLALLLNALRRSAENCSGVTDPGSSTAVKRLCRLLVSSAGANKSFTEIAREQGVSAGHLRMLFKKATGKSPIAVRNDELRRRAENLLTHSQLNVSEIASRLGFGSIYAFSRFFKRENGLSPLKFRAKILTE